jgi:hypothetical protein
MGADDRALVTRSGLRRPLLPGAGSDAAATAGAGGRSDTRWAAAARGAQTWWAAHGHGVLLAVFAVLVALALAAAWTTARGTSTLQVRVLVGLAALMVSCYLYARLRRRR